MEFPCPPSHMAYLQGAAALMAVAPPLHCARCWHTGLWPHPGWEGVCSWWTHVGPPQHRSDSAGADSVQSTTTDTQTDKNRNVIHVVTVPSSHQGHLTTIRLAYSPTAYLCSVICGCLCNWLCFIIVVLTKATSQEQQQFQFLYQLSPLQQTS